MVLNLTVNQYFAQQSFRFYSFFSFRRKSRRFSQRREKNEKWKEKNTKRKSRLHGFFFLWEPHEKDIFAFLAVGFELLYWIWICSCHKQTTQPCRLSCLPYAFLWSTHDLIYRALETQMSVNFLSVANDLQHPVCYIINKSSFGCIARKNPSFCAI